MASPRIGPNCRTGWWWAMFRTSASMPPTGCTCSTAASTRWWCWSAAALSCAAGAKGCSAARTGCASGRTARCGAPTTTGTPCASSPPRENSCCRSAIRTSHADIWRASRSTAAPTPPCRRRGRSTFPTATATRACTGFRRTGRCWPPGGSRARSPGSSTSCIRSAWTWRGGFTWRTGRTIACRCSTATATSRRSGSTCTGPAACSCAASRGRCATSRKPVPGWRSTATCRTSARACRCGRSRAGRWRNWVVGRRGWGATSSCRCTALPRTRGATSMSARRRTTVGPRCSPASRCLRVCVTFRKLVRV